MKKSLPPNYFEGILQLRKIDEKFLEQVLDIIYKDNKAFIAKEKYYKDGVDLYLSSQQYLRYLGKKLKQMFLGELKITATLHTRSKTGKDIYRVTVYFSPYKFKRGDVFNYNDQSFQILQINSRVLIKNIKSGKKEWVKLDQIKRLIL